MAHIQESSIWVIACAYTRAISQSSGTVVVIVREILSSLRKLINDADMSLIFCIFSACSLPESYLTVTRDCPRVVSSINRKKKDKWRANAHIRNPWRGGLSHKEKRAWQNLHWSWRCNISFWKADIPSFGKQYLILHLQYKYWKIWRDGKENSVVGVVDTAVS